MPSIGCKNIAAPFLNFDAWRHYNKVMWPVAKRGLTASSRFGKSVVKLCSRLLVPSLIDSHSLAKLSAEHVGGTKWTADTDRCAGVLPRVSSYCDVALATEARVCVCVCVRKRERERETETHTQRENVWSSVLVWTCDNQLKRPALITTHRATRKYTYIFVCSKKPQHQDTKINSFKNKRSLIPVVKVRGARWLWSNYGGARGGLAHLKDLAAPAKHLLWEGSRGPVKGPLKLQDDHPSIRHCNVCHSNHACAIACCMVNW